MNLVALAQTDTNSSSAVIFAGKPSTSIQADMAHNPPPTHSNSPTTALPEETLAPISLKASLEKGHILPLNLEQTLKLALGQNITIMQNEELYRQQKLNYLLALSDILPQMVFDYHQSRLVGSIQVFGGSTTAVYRTTYQPELIFSTANLGVNTYYQVKASKLLAKAQKNMLESQRQAILTQAAVGYYALQLAYWQRAIALQAIKEAEANVALNEAQIKVGTGINLNLLQAEATLSADRQNLIQAEDTVAKASTNLVQLLNFDSNVDIIPESIDSTIHRVVPDTLAYAKLVQKARVESPGIQYLQDTYESQKMQYRGALLSWLPEFTSTGYINGTGPHLDQLGLTRSIGFDITSTFSGLGLGTLVQIRSAKSLEKTAQLNVLQGQRTLEQNLANSILDMKAQAQVISAAQEELKYANEAYDSALGRLKAGVGTEVDVLTAMATLTQSRSSLATAFLTYNQDEVNIISSLGVASIATLTQGYNPDASPPAETKKHSHH